MPKTVSDSVAPRKILTYDELVKIQPGNKTEKLVDARLYDPTIICRYDKHDMKQYTGNTMLVRDSVAKKLARVNSALQIDNYTLKVVYGYRHPDVQQAYFDKRRKAIRQDQPSLSDEDVKKHTHNFVAVPDVAGHPTGGAVDVTIVDETGEELDMGLPIADYSDPSKMKTFADNITRRQNNNRQLLHDLMLSQGFAPFYGEWWHFSYGDQEWAVFYQKKTSLFGPVDITG